MELVIVMAIIALGAVLMVPNIGAWLPSYRLRSATRDVVSILRVAQMKSVATNQGYGVGFDGRSYQLYRSSGGLHPEGSPAELPTGVSFTNNNFPIDPGLNKPYANFNPNSTASAGSVVLDNSKSQKRIRLLSATGRVTIE